MSAFRLGLIALIFAHLVVHWSWVETTVARAPGSTTADPARGGPRFVKALVALGLARVVGRFVFRLRLDPPRGTADRHRTTESPGVAN